MFIETKQLLYVIRKPVYPVICDIDGYVFSGITEKDFCREIAKFSSFGGEYYHLADSTGEDWMFSPQSMALSPITFRKRWTKRKLILLVNNRKNKSEEDMDYSIKSLSSKRFERVFGDLVDLLKSRKQ